MFTNGLSKGKVVGPRCSDFVYDITNELRGDRRGERCTWCKQGHHLGMGLMGVWLDDKIVVAIT